MCIRDRISHLFQYVTGSLKDVTFEVYALEDVKSADGESEDYYKKDELVATITTCLLYTSAENKGKTGISLNCENHHSGVVKTTIQDYGESQFQNNENHNSRMVETTNPEFPESQFQNSENHHSE